MAEQLEMFPLDELKELEEIDRLAHGFMRDEQRMVSNMFMVMSVSEVFNYLTGCAFSHLLRLNTPDGLESARKLKWYVNQIEDVKSRRFAEVNHAG